MRFRILVIGLMVSLLITACGSNSLQTSTQIPLATQTPVPTNTPFLAEGVTLITDDEEFNLALTLASAQEPMLKGQPLGIGSTNVSFVFEVVDFVRGEQAMAEVAMIDPSYTAPPIGYEVGIVRAKLRRGLPSSDPLILDESKITRSVLTKGEYQSLASMQPLPCCFEPGFDAPMTKEETVEIQFPILVAIDDSNPLLVLTRVDMGADDRNHFALQ